jgi:hypothetical protein
MMQNCIHVRQVHGWYQLKQTVDENSQYTTSARVRLEKPAYLTPISCVYSELTAE